MRLRMLAPVVALGLGGLAAPSAWAVPVPLGGNPLNAVVDERGQLQAVKASDGTGIFYRLRR